MDVIHAAEMPWGESLVAQRAGGDVAHKRLFEGEEGSPDNYMLVMAKEPNSYFSPRHRHPWDQIRFCLEGKIPIAKGVYVEGGEIAYFPESAPYGPQEGGEDRIVVLLQFGGAGGRGFIGPDLLKKARLELGSKGRFEGGIYISETATGRKKRDAYEAIWMHVMGGALCYAPAAYKTPIVMRPEALSWRASGEVGVSMKRVGEFPHRGLTIRAWRIEAGARHERSPEHSLRFLFATEGHGLINGAPFRRWTAVRLEPGEDIQIAAASAAEFVDLSVTPTASL
jgi:hypothetical protein